MPTIITRGAASVRGFGFGGAGFVFDPAKTAASIVIAGGNKVTATAASFACALGLYPFVDPAIFAGLINLNSTNAGIGMGNSSTLLTNYLGFTSNSLGLFPNGQIIVSQATIGNAGFTFTTGDLIRMLLSGGKVSFSKNGGAFTTPISHGLSGTLYAGATLAAINESVSGFGG